jgi:hypothetical protein
MQVNLDEKKIRSNSELFQKANLFGETMIMVENNLFNPEISPDWGRPEDEIGGKVYLFDENVQIGSFSCDLQLLGAHHPEKQGWLGLIFRAQDVDNYELISLMPLKEKENVSRISVAHGIVAWWADWYHTSGKGTVSLNPHDWNHVQISMAKENFTVTVNEKTAFTKTYSYYLQGGICGIFVGPGTDGTFKNFQLTKES